MVLTSELEMKAKAAYYHGGQDFYTGAQLDPETPLHVYRDLGIEEQAYITEAYMNGWTDESLMQALPDGSPA